MTELFPPVLKTMAVFSRTESYFAPRGEVALPFADNEVTKLVLPRIAVWKEELSDNGDPHKSARNLLFKTLPFLANFLLQDGPYWI